MSEENNIVEEVSETDPIDEYLKNYKEHKLAEFCVQKDKEIAKHKEEKLKLINQIAEMKVKAEKFDKTWSNMRELYSAIKNLSVDDYLALYRFIINDMSGHNLLTCATVTDVSVSKFY